MTDLYDSDKLSEEQRIRAAALYTVRSIYLDDLLDPTEHIEMAEWILTGRRLILGVDVETNTEAGRLRKIVQYTREGD